MTAAPPDASELASRVASGDVSAIELVETAIAAIERLNPDINAIVSTRFERALEEAAGNYPQGPFAGVPFLTKDLGCETAGEPHYMGCRALASADHRSTQTSYLADHFRNAGFINLGRAATPEFGSTITTEPLLGGPCRNPWDLDRSTGGSSGGSAAAVAAGIVPVAHAGDGGGSIRVPASECGLVGLKPTRGRVSSGPTLGESWGGLATDFVVTRSVRDAASILDAVSGPMPGDPYWAQQPEQTFATEATRDPGRLRIALISNLEDGLVHRECVAAVEKAGLLLQDLGHDVVDDSCDLLETEHFIEDLVTIISVATLADLTFVESVIGRTAGPDDIEATNHRYATLGQRATGTDYLGAIENMHAYGRRMAGYWDESSYDVVVTPTLGEPPPLIGEIPGPEGDAKLGALLRFTARFNMTGQPAISLPLHSTDDGLPVGVQFVGAAGAESTLLRLATQIETAAPWAHRTPPLFASLGGR